MDRLIVHPEVRDALADHRPVVLLESAVTTCGLPRSAWHWADGDAIRGIAPAWQLDQPVNLELARVMSATVRAGGSVPATVAIMNGHWHVGLDPDDLESLALDETAGKASISTAAGALVGGGCSGTTVSAALTAANLVRQSTGSAPQVMATGGIGGVHRGWAQRPDVSADLGVIARTPVVVVSAGVKSIVDVPATGEWLETLGVPVLGLGTDVLPCFIAGVDRRAPGIRRVSSEAEAAELIRAHWDGVDNRGGVMLTVPLEGDLVLAGDLVEEANRAAEDAASTVDGPDRTPYLLSHLAEATGGRSLVANIALLVRNAAVASALAGTLGDGSS